MPNWGPVSVTIGPGATTPDSQSAVIFDSGPISPGSLTQVEGTVSVSFVGGKSDAFWNNFLRVTRADGTFIANGTDLVSFRLTTTAAAWSYPVPLDAARVIVFFGGALYAGQTMTCVANGTTSTAIHCEHGTHAKPATPATLILTNDNIIAALALFGAEELIVAFYTVLGLAIDLTGLCAAPPGQLPAINTPLIQASNDEKLAVLRVLLWFNYCECVPGTPAPVPFPTPVVTIPADFPATPAFPCDPANLCASLEAIREQLQALAQTTSSALELVTLQQRYRLPFAYVPGAAHSGLSGEGQFAVSRLLGMRVEITARPPDTDVLRGNPPYLIDMGWMAIEDANGMWEEKRITRDDQLWFPLGMPAAATFSWSLFPGVTIRATELQAET